MFHQNPFRWSRVVPYGRTDRQTDRDMMTLSLLAIIRTRLLKHYKLPNINGIEKRMFRRVCREQNFTQLSDYVTSVFNVLRNASPERRHKQKCSSLYQLAGKVSFRSSMASAIVF